MKRLKACGVMALALLLAACGKHQGEQFIGTWKLAVPSPYCGSDITITRNGDGFIVSQTCRSSSERLAAVAAGDQLAVSTEAGSIQMTIDQKSGHLLYGPQEYAKK